MEQQYLDDRRAEDTPLIRSSSSTFDSTPWRIQEEGCTHNLLIKNLGKCHTWRESYLQYCEEDWERIRENWLHRFHRRRFKTRFEICKNADKELKRYSCDPKTLRGQNYSFETDELRDVPPQGEVTHTEECVTQRTNDTQKREYTHSIYRTRVHILCCRMWVKHEIIIPPQKLNW